MADSHVVAGGFTPHALIPISVGRFTVNLYSIVNATMMVQERTHAFQINKAALLSLNLDLHTMLDALGAQLDLSASVEGMIEEWLRLFQDSCFDFSALQILSFPGRVRKSTTWTGMAHSPNIVPHCWPIVAKSDLMQCLVCIQMTTDSIGVKGHEDCIIQRLRNQLQARVRITSCDRLLEN